MNSNTRVWTDIVIPPGLTLAENLDALGMTQAELARRCGRPPQVINEIIKGTKQITSETAIQFEQVLGIPAHFWVFRETEHQLNKARLEQLEHLEKEAGLVDQFPYAEMAGNGWVTRTRSRIEKARQLLQFFGVVSLNQVKDHFEDAVPAFRRSSKLRHVSPGALAAWLRQGERVAQLAEAGTFNKGGLRRRLSEIRQMTRDDPDEFDPKLRMCLAENGVVLVLVEHLRSTGAHGATYWLGGKAVVQMSVRYRWDDVFWFSFFHELGHVLLHGRNERFVEFNSGGRDPRESEADAFAARTLIPDDAYADFVLRHKRRFSSKTVSNFAAAVDVAPSIVVGRLQHDRQIPFKNLNGLRSQFRIVSHTHKQGLDG